MTATKFYLKAKPCPFCGETDELEVTPHYRFVTNGGSNKDVGACVSVTCNRCNVEMYDFTREETDYGKRLWILLDKWNAREVSEDE